MNHQSHEASDTWTAWILLCLTLWQAPTWSHSLLRAPWASIQGRARDNKLFKLRNEHCTIQRTFQEWAACLLRHGKQHSPTGSRLLQFSKQSKANNLLLFKKILEPGLACVFMPRRTLRHIKSQDIAGSGAKKFAFLRSMFPHWKSVRLLSYFAYFGYFGQFWLLQCQLWHLLDLLLLKLFNLRSHLANMGHF